MLLHCSSVLIALALTQGACATSTSTHSEEPDRCPVTETIEGTPPPQRGASPFGIGTYHVNEDRSMWLYSRPWTAGISDKTIWIRPEGTVLKVAGRRLDGEAPPLYVSLPPGYPTGFQAGSMTFPTEGCWEVRATAGKKELVFVVTVAPAPTERLNGT